MVVHWQGTRRHQTHSQRFPTAAGPKTLLAHTQRTARHSASRTGWFSEGTISHLSSAILILRQTCPFRCRYVGRGFDARCGTDCTSHHFNSFYLTTQNAQNQSVPPPRAPSTASILSHHQKATLALGRKVAPVPQVLTGDTGKVLGTERRTSNIFAVNRQPPACNVRAHTLPSAASVPPFSGAVGSRFPCYSSVPDDLRHSHSHHCEELQGPSRYSNIPPPCELTRMSPSRPHVGRDAPFASTHDYLGCSLDTPFPDWEQPEFPGCQAPPVTLESPDRETGTANEPFDLTATASHDQPLAAEFPYFDDFTFSPGPSTRGASSSELLTDDTMDLTSSYPSAEAAPSKGLARFSSQSRFFVPKPNSSIGPAKTVRHQFAAFQRGLAPFRNRAPPTSAASFQDLAPSRSGRGNTTSSSGRVKRRRTEPSPQSNTLLNYFSVY